MHSSIPDSSITIPLMELSYRLPAKTSTSTREVILSVFLDNLTATTLVTFPQPQVQVGEAARAPTAVTIAPSVSTLGEAGISTSPSPESTPADDPKPIPEVVIIPRVDPDAPPVPAVSVLGYELANMIIQSRLSIEGCRVMVHIPATAAVEGVSAGAPSTPMTLMSSHSSDGFTFPFFIGYGPLCVYICMHIHSNMVGDGVTVGVSCTISRPRPRRGCPSPPSPRTPGCT